MITTQRTVALVGNPNAGKTSIFNALTGADRHTGNWPGKTVERLGGSHRGRFEVVDLPGTYSLSALSAEEAVTREELLAGVVDVVVVVVDATNLERNLYLAVQILELGKPVVVALNMCDAADARGLKIDARLLSETLGVPVVRTVARRGMGINELVEAIQAAGQPAALRIHYGAILEPVVEELEALIADRHPLGPASRWLALELLDEESDLRSEVATWDGGAEVIGAVDAVTESLSTRLGGAVWVVIADRRYGWIRDLILEAVELPAKDTVPISDRIDRWAAHRRLGLPIFVATMWLVLKFTTDVSAAYVDWVDAVIHGPVARWGVAGLTLLSLDGTAVESLLVEGILTGVGGILVFIPVLVCLYVCLAILEDSGYLARAALVMDRVMRRLGLPGKSFIPMMVGFGCTVPAIYATRTLARRKDRVLTGLLVPFMSCGARLPVYVLFATVFFAGGRGAVVFSMYLGGILVALAVGFLLSRTTFRDHETMPLVVELPPYRIPTFGGVWRYTRLRVAAFLKDASTIILGTSLVVWLLMAVPTAGGSFSDTKVEDSAFGSIAQTAAPLFSPAGFGSWEAAGSLMAGFVAKEVVVTSLAQTYGASEGRSASTETDLGSDLRWIASEFLGATVDTVKAVPSVVGIEFPREPEEPTSTGLLTSIRDGFKESSGGHGAAAGLAFLVFVLLYTPCMAAVAVERRELGSRWMWTSVIGQTGLAWIMATLVFQIGKRVGLG